MNKYKELVSNTIIFAIGNFMSKFLMFVLMPLYTSVLTTEQYSVAEMLNTAIELIIPIFTLCIVDGVFRFCIDEDNDIKQILNNGIAVISIGFCILLLFVPILYKFISREYILSFILLYLTTAYKNVFLQFARGINKVKEFAIAGIISSIIMIIANIVLLKFINMGVVGYLLSITISNVVTIIYIFIKLDIVKKLSMKYIDNFLLKKMIIYSVYLVPNSISWWITNIANRYIVIIFCGANVGGLFLAASKIPSLINIISTIFQQAWQFSSSKEYKSDSKEIFYSTTLKYYSMMILIGGSFIILITPYISKFILSGDFYSGWIYAPLLIVSAIIGCYSYYFGTIYIVVKNNRMNMISTIIGAIASLISSIILVPTMGVIGATISMIISYSIITIIRIIDTNKYIKLTVNYKKIILSVVLLIVQSIILISKLHNKIILSIIIFLIILLIHTKDAFKLYNNIYNEFINNK
ncbi:lipopolysaccharide biosynthesis protein [Clostridium perfringens]|uniref:lipopolysaccharide biosynthesis protein n=1 Tax=Clostridium perfringens TaxID=1502 RepID=UPI00214D388C|nr:polysaccharide biosynthesis C-terminal domain-containing protein [Clostridium perfringens]MDM0608548.1 polysaccharide biosynthesis C-terminal domain-containing protein [Clostridium perfringens]UUW66453.1 polysaccharide biosynthesis C-terminal domain-containing protein [Clostridium perfringens]